MLLEFLILCLAVTVAMSPAILFACGCSEIAKYVHSRSRTRRDNEQKKQDLYRVAEYVGLHRANHCGCPNCGGSYSGHIAEINGHDETLGTDCPCPICVELAEVHNIAMSAEEAHDVG